MRQEKQIELPDWLNPDVWFDYVDHRRTLKKPMSKRAKELAIMKLDKLRISEDPRFIIDRSIDCGWAGLFPQKEQVTSSVTREANTKGLSARPGESWDDYNQRIQRTR